MCRIAAYFGPPVPLSSLLEGPLHGLSHQSLAAREMTDSSVAGDGWAVGWLEADRPPGLLKSTLPLWSCLNAKTAPHAITSGSIVGHVRLASEGIETCFLNTPLYAYGGYLYMANGEMRPWPGPLARALRSELDGEDDAGVQGSTDAEMLGALWHTCLRRTGDPAAAVRDALRVASDAAARNGGAVKMNVIVAGRGGFVAARYAQAEKPNTLYTFARGGGSLVASEPFDDGPGWRAVEPSTLVRADGRGLPQEPLNL